MDSFKNKFNGNQVKSSKKELRFNLIKPHTRMGLAHLGKAYCWYFEPEKGNDLGGIAFNDPLVAEHVAQFFMQIAQSLRDNPDGLKKQVKIDGDAMAENADVAYTPSVAMSEGDVPHPVAETSTTDASNIAKEVEASQ